MWLKDCKRLHVITLSRCLEAQTAGAHRDAYTGIEKQVIKIAHLTLIRDQQDAEGAGRGNENTSSTNGKERNRLQKKHLAPVANDAKSSLGNDPPQNTELRAWAAHRGQKITEARKRLAQLIENEKIASPHLFAEQIEIPHLFADLINLAVAIGVIKVPEARELREVLQRSDLVRLENNSLFLYKEAEEKSPPEF